MILKEKFNEIEISIFHLKYVDMETYLNKQSNVSKIMVFL